MQNRIYSRNCFLRSPLGAAKNSLKRQVVCETRVAKTCPCKVNTFLLLQFEGEGIFRTVATNLQLYTLISYIFAVQSLHNMWFRAYTSLQQGTVYMCTQMWSHTQVHLRVNGSVCAKSGGRWSRSAGSRSPQRLFCTKLSVHEISVIKGRWSLTTEIVKSSFNCTCTCTLYIVGKAF